jgi:hypothetical protein
VDDAGALIRPALRESGFWRPGAGADDVEVTIAAMTGLVEVFTGVAGNVTWELETALVGRAPTAVEVERERRFYAVVGDELHYATELGRPGQDLAPHLNGTLKRTSQPE